MRALAFAYGGGGLGGSAFAESRAADYAEVMKGDDGKDGRYNAAYFAWSIAADLIRMAEADQSAPQLPSHPYLTKLEADARAFAAS
jgi:hypothetical protein